MTTVNDILNWFEDFAPVKTAMDFDNCGLLVGSSDKAVTNVLVSLDITSGVVEEARKLGCELIISHHPVIFNPIKRLDEGDAVYLLAKYGIAAICMHTNLDLSETFGVNTCLAEAVGVTGLKKCEDGECLFIGELPEELDADKFALRVKTTLGCNGLRYTAPKPTVKIVGVSSGAGGSDIFAVAKAGADVLLTGEVKHHEINAGNELGVGIIDTGHFKSEDVVIFPLIERLRKNFSDTTFTKSSTYSDFMKYIS